eukprot:1431719-Pyramimonas_sp.AAC.1
MITDNSALVTVAEEQPGHRPAWGHPRSSDIEETYHVPLCSTGEGHSYGLDSDESGPSIRLCFTAEMSKVVLSEHQRRIQAFDRVTTMRVYVTAAAERAAVARGDDLPRRPTSRRT